MSLALAGMVSGAILGSFTGTRLSRRATVAAAAVAVAPYATAASLWYAPKALTGPMLAASFMGTSLLFAMLAGRFGKGWAVALAASVVIASSVWLAGGVSGPVHDVRLMSLADQCAPAPDGHYGFDGEIFLHVIDNMRAGDPYYVAYLRAMRADKRYADDYLPASPLNVREPLLFWLWSALPSGGPLAVFFLYFIAAAVASAMSWWFARGFVGSAAALLAPLGVSTYFIFVSWVVSTHWVFPEIWASVAVVVGLSFASRERWVSAAVMLVLAVAMRELAVLFLPGFLVMWWFVADRRRAWPAAVLATTGPVLVLVAHWAVSASFYRESGGGAPDLSSWLHGGLDRLWAALVFGQEAHLIGWLTAASFLVFSLLGGHFVRDVRWRKGLLLTVTVPLVFLAAFSSGEWSYYWGMMIVPVLAMLAPLGLLVFSKRADAQAA